MKAKQLLTYRYKESVDRVFQSFKKVSCLSEGGKYTNFVKINSVKEQGSQMNEESLFELVFFPKGKALIKIERSKQKEDVKTIYYRILKVNDILVRNCFEIKIRFFWNSCDNETIAFSFVKYHEADGSLVQEYQNLWSKERYAFFQAMEKAIRVNTKFTSQLDSIVINRPFSQTYKYVSNIENLVESKNEFFNSKSDNKFYIDEQIIKGDKILIKLVKNNTINCLIKRISILIVRLSSISCYVSIENEVKNNVDPKYLKTISTLQQNLLSFIKKNVEKMVCEF